MRFIPASPHALRLIEAYLDVAGHGDDPAAPLSRPLHRNRDQADSRALDPQSVYENVVRHYCPATGFNKLAFCVLRRGSLHRDGRRPASRNGPSIT